MSNDSIVIVNAARTAMAGFQGCLSGMTAADLGARAISAAIERSGLVPEDIDDVIMGCVLPAGLKQGPARQAMRKAGIPDSTGATTINKLCGSGMKAAMFAHDMIKAGSIKVAVAGGMESMTNAPYVMEKVRAGLRMGHSTVKDHMFLDGLEDAETGRLMGAFAQEMADKRGITREAMDEFAINSLSRANKAIAEGAFRDEVVSCKVKTRKGEVIVDTDEQPGNARPEKIPLLRPAFAADGTVTAANSSSISDGAAALVIMAESEAQRRGLNPMARIVGHASHSQHPSLFTTAPVGALEKLFASIGWKVQDVDLFEINEAFAMVTMIATEELALDPERVNVHGGACALGHPIGASGARIVATLLYALRRYGGRKGVAGICIGGGEATALAVEMM